MKHTVHSVGEVHIHSYANLVLMQRIYARMEDRRFKKERKLFLERELKTHGKLVCHYCSNPNLKLKTDKRHEQATVDHFVPKSKGGDEWNPSNFVVCCNSCNKKKASHDAEKFAKSKYVFRKKASLPKV